MATSCGGSKANVRKDEAEYTSLHVVDVTTAPAIMRELPRFFEATGSLTGDQQTDVAPSVAGKVVSIGVELGSYVKRGQTIVRLDDVDAKLRVQQAQAQVEQVKAALAAGGRKGRSSQRANRSIRTKFRKSRMLEWRWSWPRRTCDAPEKLIESGDISRSVYDQQKAQRDQLKEAV